jgi:RimJ/RimL family protein N-acetyltransferase
MGNIQLRALTETDIPTTLAWNNQEDIKDLYAGHPFPVNYEMEKEWYNKITKLNFPTTVFGIELIQEKKLIGLSFLKNINMIHRKAEFAIFIGDEKERGKGYSKDATLKTLKFGFNSLGLQRIYLSVQDNNETAIKLYEKVGFIKEGLLRNSTFKNGTFYNEIIMGLLISDLNINEL